MGSGLAKLEDFVPFGEFPSPYLLANAHRDYATAVARLKSSEAKKSSDLPAPFPPLTTKEEVFNPKDYEAIDEHAKNTPFEEADKTYGRLASYLIKKATNEIGKVRAFFVWIASQNVQLVQQRAEPTNGSPMHTVFSMKSDGKAKTQIYLLSRLCYEVKIPCKEVTSQKVKGASYVVGDETTIRSNVYCLVYVDKSWRIIDLNWGSVCDTNPNDGNSYTYRFNDFYFLTDPEAYIYRHWTSNFVDQLLARPVTEEEFVDMACLSESFHKFGFIDIEPRKCRIVVECGETVIRLRCPIGWKDDFHFKLYTHESKNYDKNTRFNKLPLDRFVFSEWRDEKLQVTVTLPIPERYRFEVHCRFADDCKRETTMICEYILDCRKPAFLPDLCPDDSNRVWGPTYESDSLGISQANKGIGGLIVTKDGKIEIKYDRSATSDKSLMEFRHSISSSEVKKEEMINHLLHFVTDVNIAVRMEIPKHGNYIYEMTGRRDSKSNWIPLFNYFIKALQASPDVDLLPFPKSSSSSNNQQMGDLLSSSKKKYLEPDNHKDPFIVWDKEEELIIRMKIIKRVNYTASLKLSSKNQQQGTDYSGYVLMQTTKNTDDSLSFSIKFPKFGTYTLMIGSKEEKNGIYKYVIKVTKVGRKTLPYPKLNHLAKQFRLIEPRINFIECNQDVHFEMMIEGVISVVVTCNGVDNILRKGVVNGWWEGDVKTGQKKEQIGVFVQTTSQAQPQSILTYQVENKDKIRELLDDQEKFASEAEEQKRKVEEKRVEKSEAAEQRKKDLAKRRAEEEAHFKKNEKEFIMKVRQSVEEQEPEGMPMSSSTMTTLEIPPEPGRQTSAGADFVNRQNTSADAGLEASSSVRQDLDRVTETLRGIWISDDLAPSVRDVLRAALLLIDQPEDKNFKKELNDWKKRTGLGLDRITAASKHPRILARIKEILKSIDGNEELKTNEDLLILHGWISGVIEDVTISDDVKPANIDRQYKIFNVHRPTISWLQRNKNEN